MRHRMLTLVLLGFAAVWPSAGSARAAQAAGAAPPAVRVGPLPVASVDAEYRIGPEDVVSIVVLGQPDYSRSVPVRPDGKISLPAVNDVEAAGLTPMELRAVLLKAFESFIKAEVLEVSVIVTEVHSFKVSVFGQVRTPMRFELRSKATIVDALAMAGGFTEFARKDRIQVRRADGTSLIFNYDSFLGRGDSLDNLLLRPGDIIIVPS